MLTRVWRWVVLIEALSLGVVAVAGLSLQQHQQQQSPFRRRRRSSTVQHHYYSPSPSSAFKSSDRNVVADDAHENRLLHHGALRISINGDDEAKINVAASNNDDDGAVLPSSASDDRITAMKLRSSPYDLAQAAIVGTMSGLLVAVFKLTIEAVREFCYEQPALVDSPALLVLIPATGGLVVGAAQLLGDFAPGLRGTVKEVDEDSTRPVQRDLMDTLQIQLCSIRKSIAAVATLGTGCSLGPEGPCVEIGLSVARACTDLNLGRQDRRLYSNRLLLSCGAAAGVAAGFNAPLAGVFFALEIIQNAFTTTPIERNVDGEFDGTGQYALSSATNITPILLASVLSALISRGLLGNQLVLSLTDYSLKTPLIELPLYLLLGTICGFVAFLFSQVANLTLSLFDGSLGNDGIQTAFRSIPAALKPVLGGLFCGVVGLVFPQVLFFGYETLNSLLLDNSLPTNQLLTLFLVKTMTTAVCVGSTLIGGTFAPALFLGAVVGGTFHNTMGGLLAAIDISNIDFLGELFSVGLADVPAYAMVGAASVLAALYRSPLTATLLLFELTRDYEVILPLMVSAGVGSLVGDVLDDEFERRRRDLDAVSWGDLADDEGKVSTI